jgi:uncharacterized membrane protein
VDRVGREAARASTRPSALRLESVDFLRGAAMVLMALDHVRHFFSNSLSNRPTDLTETSAGLFLTRWVTHFCAPIFVFLAGTAGFLAAARGKAKGELATFLWSRGVWLILLELTVIRCFGWVFNFDYRYVMGGVIWVLGWSMIALSPMVYLPEAIVGGFGIAMIAGHDLFDSVRPSSFGPLGWLWKILHTPGQVQPFPGVHFKVAYPLIPWIGVMAAGYGFGALLVRPRIERQRACVCLGLGLTAGFILLRMINVYGDPRPWTPQRDALFTFFSFLNCDKYPPSLLFLLMTLGPSILAFAFFDFLPRSIAFPFVVLGRVPLFFYLLHLPFIHMLAVLFAYLRHGDASWLFASPPSARGGAPFPFPEGYGYGLVVVYAVWFGVVAALFPACLWFGKRKQARGRRNPWLSYI